MLLYFYFGLKILINITAKKTIEIVSISFLVTCVDFLVTRVSNKFVL